MRRPRTGGKGFQLAVFTVRWFVLINGAAHSDLVRRFNQRFGCHRLAPFANIRIGDPFWFTSVVSCERARWQVPADDWSLHPERSA